MKYNKILITGGIGSGKTTLANKLSKIIKTKNYELDNIVYRRRDIHIKNSPMVRNKKLQLILKKRKWILEGFHNHPWTHPIYKKADLIIILEVKSFISKKRIITRYLKRKLSFEKNKDINQHINKNFKIMLKLLEGINKKHAKILREQKKIAKNFNGNVLVLNKKKEIKKFLEFLKEEDLHNMKTI